MLSMSKANLRLFVCSGIHVFHEPKGCTQKGLKGEANRRIDPLRWMAMFPYLVRSPRTH